MSDEQQAGNVSGNVTWRVLIQEERDSRGDVSPVVAVAPKDLDLDRPFDDGYGLHEGEPFTLWTVRRVYFPVVYDGAEWVASVSRNPDGVATEHVGGE